MYLTHGSQASVEGFGDRDGRRGARGTEDHREVSGIGDSSESLVGSVRSLRRHARDLPGGLRRRTTAAAGPGPGPSGLPAPLPGHHSTQYGALQNRASSPPGQGLFREPGAVASGKRTHGPGRGLCLTDDSPTTTFVAAPARQRLGATLTAIQSPTPTASRRWSATDIESMPNH